MFTGIILHSGVIEAFDRKDSGARLHGASDPQFLTIFVLR